MVQSPHTSGGVTLSYTDDEPPYRRIVERIDTCDRLLERLYEIQESRKASLFIGVNVNDVANNGLAVALADGSWAVLFGDAAATELFYSQSTRAAEGDVEVRFEQWEVLPRKCFIPVQQAIDVIRTWFDTGKLSQVVRWERKSLLPEQQ